MHDRNGEQLDKVNRINQHDNPGTNIERWRAGCLTSKVLALAKAGRDVTIIIGPPTGRTVPDFHVVIQEETN